LIEDILIVDDEPLMRKFLQEALSRKGYEIDISSDGEDAIKKIGMNSYDLIFTDLKLPKADGITVLKKAKELSDDTTVIMMTAYGTVETAVEAMKIGAFDYLLKPFSPDQIELLLNRVIERKSLINENNYLRAEVNREYDFNEIVGKTPEMVAVFDLIKKVASSKATVLIQGESGTGKELVARAIHYNSPRKDKPFIKMNCAAIPENLLESELFGHEKGSFTGAYNKRLGRFELADGGTLFLDEISEISPALQAKLLRVLQEREFERVGGMRPIKVDVRIISTTNRDLKEEIKKNTFREDLFYRLNVVPFLLSPLRDRVDDISLLAQHFLSKYAKENNKREQKITKETLELMKGYRWPGNIRELENIIERIVVMDLGDKVLPGHIKSWIQNEAETSENVFRTGQSLEEMEKSLIMETLKQCNGNRTQSADVLQISIRTLRNKLNLYKEQGVDIPS